MRHDVIVTGGGPAGSTAANLLSRAGAKVLLLEREVFPRFHIGESLLPCDLAVFERLGVEMQGTSAHLRKAGAEFFDEADGLWAEYPFDDSLPGTPDHAWQVDRATFDHQLLEAAKAAGAVVREGEAVTDVALDGPDGVTVTTDRGRHEARYLIDATGQDALLARLHRTKRSIRDFGLAAVHGHYGGLRPDAAAELSEKGNIRILFIDDGWIWAAPLGEARLSVGVVTRKKGIAPEWLERHVAESPSLSALLEGARLEGPPKRSGSFSFYNDRAHGPRWACVGDAACFLDPVFSSGVSFGMVGAAHAADELIAGLREGREADAELMAPHQAWMHEAYVVFGSLIRSLYLRRLVPGIFFTKDQDPELRQGLTTVLAGDVWRDDNRFQNQLTASRRRFDVARQTG